MRSILFFLIISYLQTCQAQEVEAQNLTMSEMIDLALKSNPTTKIQWLRAKSQREKLKIDQTALKPTVTFDASATKGHDFKFINGPDVDFTILGANFSLNYLLLDFGQTNLQIKAAKAALEAAQWQTNFEIQKVIVSLMEKNYQVIYLQQILAAAKITEQESSLMNARAKQLHSLGLKPVTDLLSTKARLSKAIIDRLDSEKNLLNKKYELATLLGLNPQTNINIETAADVPLNCIENICALTDQALTKRADYLSKKMQLLESKELYEKSKKAYYPKIYLSGQGGMNHAFQDNTDGAQYRIKLNFDIPLYDGFRRIYEKNIAYNKLESSRLELYNLALEITLEVAKYRNELIMSQQMLTHAEEAHKQAKLAYDASFKSYLAGLVSLPSVSDSLQDLASARVKLAEIKTKILINTANLAFAIGTIK